MAEKVLITGATGLIGKALVAQCREAGMSVHYFTTRKEKIVDEINYRGFYWNPSKALIDEAAFEGVDSIVHLAGAPISQRWTSQAKKEILDSRIQPMQLMYDVLKEKDHNIGYFVSASGINVYPSSETKLYTEEDEVTPNTFLSEVVSQWEEQAKRFKDIGMDVAKVRTGMVLAKDGGALPQFAQPIRLGFGAPLGKGSQWVSWIHIKDIVGVYYFLLQNKFDGVYNAVATNPVQNKRLTEVVAHRLKKPLWMPNVPEFALKALLGEMSDLVLESQLVSSNKIKKLGYPFYYYNVEAALEDLLEK